MNTMAQEYEYAERNEQPASLAISAVAMPSDPLSKAVTALRDQATPKPSTTTPFSRSPVPRQRVMFSPEVMTTPTPKHINGRDTMNGVSALKMGSPAYVSPGFRRMFHRNVYSSPAPGSNASRNVSNTFTSPAPSSGFKRAICQKYDEEFKQTLLEQEIEYKARLQSVRNVTFMTVILFGLYLVFGSLYYSRWSDGARWPIEESLIFLVYTATTVGYGNHSIPSSPGDRVATISFIMFGIALVTVFLSEIFQYIVIETARAQYTHDEEKITNRGLRIFQALAHDNDDEDNDEDVNLSMMRKTKTNVCRFSHFYRSLVFDTYSRCNRCLEKYFLGKVLKNLLPFTVLLVVGATVVGRIEGWSAIDSLYWAIVTMTTVGYGDLAPSKPASIWFCIFYLPSSAFFLSLFLSKVAAAYIRIHVAQIARIEKRLRHRHGYDNEGDMLDIEEGEGDEFDHHSPLTIHMARSGDTEGSSPESDHERHTHKVNPPPASPVGFSPSITITTPSTLRKNRQRLLSKGSMSMSMRDILASAKKGDKMFRSTRNLFEGDSGANTPSLALRARVQERLAYIIATEFSGGEKPKIEVKGDHVQLTFSNWKAATETWMIPKKVKEPLKSVACEIILSVGTNVLKEQGVDSLLELDPDHFQRRFNPVIAHFGSAECMEGWLRSTENLVVAKE